MKYIKPHVLQAIAWYPFNTAHVDIIEEVYGTEHHQSYIDEKTALLNKRGLLWLFGQLDSPHRRKLCEAIEHKYMAYLEDMNERINRKL